MNAWRHFTHNEGMECVFSRFVMKLPAELCRTNVAIEVVVVIDVTQKVMKRNNVWIDGVFEKKFALFQR